MSTRDKGKVYNCPICGRHVFAWDGRAKVWMCHWQSCSHTRKHSDITFSEYRVKCLLLLWAKYDILSVASLPCFSRFRIDNICAEHWKRDDVFIDCVLELEHHLVNDLKVKRI